MLYIDIQTFYLCTYKVVFHLPTCIDWTLYICYCVLRSLIGIIYFCSVYPELLYLYSFLSKWSIPMQQWTMHQIF